MATLAVKRWAHIRISISMVKEEQLLLQNATVDYPHFNKKLITQTIIEISGVWNKMYGICNKDSIHFNVENVSDNKSHIFLLFVTNFYSVTINVRIFSSSLKVWNICIYSTLYPWIYQIHAFAIWNSYVNMSSKALVIMFNVCYVT